MSLAEEYKKFLRSTQQNNDDKNEPIPAVAPTVEPIEVISEEEDLENASYETLLQLDQNNVIIGLSKDQINQMPVSRFDSLSFKKRSERRYFHKFIVYVSRDCAICLTEYENGVCLRTLPCFHKFHRECIDEWFKNHVQCPICKVDIRTKLN